MHGIDINQLQFKELAASISTKSISLGATLPEKERSFLYSKIQEFLGESKRMIVTNRKALNSDGYFVLDISLKGLRLLKSKSVSRTEYIYSFKTNEFKLNGRVVDVSFLDQFISFFDFMSNDLLQGKYEIIEES